MGYGRFPQAARTQLGGTEIRVGVTLSDGELVCNAISWSRKATAFSVRSVSSSSRRGIQ
jgi:hypothetical protein